MAVVREDDDLAKEARELNRFVRWRPRKGITYAADPRYVEKSIVKQQQRNSRPCQHGTRRKRDAKQRR